MSQPFHNEKISAPFLGKLVERRAIVASFKRTDPQVVWISSPGGSGKTALALQLAHASRRLTLWYNIDTIDDDPAVFFNSLREAAVNAGARADEIPEIIADDLKHLRSFAVYFFFRMKQSLGCDYVLVFDNYQRLHTEAPLHHLLVQVISTQLPDIRVIVTSRAEMPSPWPTLDAEASLMSIGWPQLRIDNEEIAGFLSLEAGLSDLRHDPGVVSALARNSDGWVAGLKLLLVMLKHRPDDFEIGQLDQGRYQIFRYFSSEVIAGMDERTRQVLLKTAILPFMPLNLLNDLCEDDQAASVIQGLFRRQFFISRRSEDRNEAAECYLFHDLMRDYLVQSFRSAFNPTQQQRLKQSAGQLLMRDGWTEGALHLLLDAGCWHESLDLLEKLAPAWVNSGRTASLRRLIEQLPSEYRRQRAKIEYWYGQCLLPMRLHEALDCFHSAYRKFSEMADLEGRVLSWYGAILAIWLEWGDCKRLDTWIDELGELRHELDELRHEAVSDEKKLEELLAMGAVTAMSLRQMDHPDMPYWEQRNLDMLDRGELPLSEMIFRGLQLMIHYTWGVGDREKSQQVMDYLRYALNDERCTETAQCVSGVMLSAHNYWFSPSVDVCLNHVDSGLAKAARFGMPFWDNIMINVALFKLCSVRDAQGASKYLELMSQRLHEHSSKNEVAVYYHFKGYIAWLEQNYEAALLAVDRAMALGVSTGFSFSPTYYRLLIARIRADMGETRKALLLAAQSRREAKSFNSDCLIYTALLVSADILHEAGQAERAMGFAAAAFEIGERQRYYTEPYIKETSYLALCRAALRRSPQSSYLKERIALLSTSSRAVCTIRTLGRFTIEQAGQPENSSRKQAKVPMHLLLRLIAAGEGNSLDSAALIEAVWPGTEFRKGYARLKSTVQRLRDMLGADDVLLFSDGRLRLDETLCEVDAWCFDSQSKREGALDEGRLQQLFDLYQGPFCDQPNEDEGVVIYRSALESRYESLVKRMAENLARRDEWVRMLELYQQALMRSPNNSTFVSGVAECLSRLGREQELQAFMRSIDVF